MTSWRQTVWNALCHLSFCEKDPSYRGTKKQRGVSCDRCGRSEAPGSRGDRRWCPGPVTVLETPDQAENFVKTEGEKLCIVSQTTYNYNKFQYIVEIFEKKGYNDSVVNTICNATEERQRSAKTIAADADVMIVIGGKHSSNSRKLYEICQRECEHTYFIQNWMTCI